MTTKRIAALLWGVLAVECWSHGPRIVAGVAGLMR